MNVVGLWIVLAVLSALVFIGCSKDEPQQPPSFMLRSGGDVVIGR